MLKSKSGVEGEVGSSERVSSKETVVNASNCQVFPNSWSVHIDEIENKRKYKRQSIARNSRHGVNGAGVL